jgi:hypothetical protein
LLVSYFKKAHIHTLIRPYGARAIQKWLLEKLEILADANDEGILLQLFTKPIGAGSTFCIEISQHIARLSIHTQRLT